MLEAKKVPTLLPGPGTEDPNGVPAPSSRGMLGKARAVANRAFAESIPVEADGHGNGHGPAGAGEEHAAVGSAGPRPAPRRGQLGRGLWQLVVSPKAAARRTV